MKYTIVFFIVIFIACDNITDPKEELIFFKDINQELFPSNLTAEITTYQDTSFDSQGNYRILDLPEVKLLVDKNKMVFDYGASIITSSNIEFTDTLNNQNRHAGIYAFSSIPANFYSVKIKDSELEKVYIRMKEWLGEKRQYFLIGINLRD